MKKILAIAVATAISAPAMADMTISGTIIAGVTASTDGYQTVTAPSYVYDTDTYADDTVASDKGQYGFGIDTAALNIAGSETLENGITVAGYMNVGGLTRSAGVAGENAGLSFAGDFGTFSIDAKKVPTAYVNVAGPADNFAGEITGESVVDIVAYSAPAMGALTLGVAFTETGAGIGKGGAKDIDPEVSAKVATGGFSGFAAYKTYAADGTNSRARLGAGFDAGVVNLTVGMERMDYNAATADKTTTSASVSAPMGALTVGASYVREKSTGSAADSGVSVAMSYALSSNVSVSAKHNVYDSSTTGEEETASYLLTTLSF